MSKKRKNISKDTGQICKSILDIVGNENKQMWFASVKEVRRMIDTGCLIATIYILFYALVGMTIIAVALIVALATILSKQK